MLEKNELETFLKNVVEKLEDEIVLFLSFLIFHRTKKTFFEVLKQKGFLHGCFIYFFEKVVLRHCVRIFVEKKLILNATEGELFVNILKNLRLLNGKI